MCVCVGGELIDNIIEGWKGGGDKTFQTKSRVEKARIGSFIDFQSTAALCCTSAPFNEFRPAFHQRRSVWQLQRLKATEMERGNSVSTCV